MKNPVSPFCWKKICSCLFLIGASLLPSYALQPGFSSETILTQLYHPAGITFHPVGIAFLPDGRMLVAQKEGAIMIAEGPDYDTTAIYLDRTSDINFYEERGVMGFAIDPDFNANGYIYVYYNPISRDFYRIARFTHIENQGGITSRADTNSQVIIWEDIENYHFAFFHFGGALNFGPDGKLYLGTGERNIGFSDPFNGVRAQDTSLYSGKILRINKDGSVPDGSDGFPANPFINGPGLDEIWAIGLRNPFKATWDIPTGRYFIADVGSNGEHPAVWEDIHLCKADSDYAGLNYGWPDCEGPPPFVDYPDCQIQNPLADPIFSYKHDAFQGCIIGGPVYRGNHFPRQPYYGSYFYGDFVTGKIRYLVFDHYENLVSDNDFAEGFRLLTAIEQGPDGNLYIAHYTGEVIRISYDTTNALQSCVVAAEKRVELHRNTVLSGGVAAWDDYGKVALDYYSVVTAPGTFARASEVALRHGSAVANRVNLPPAMVLPPFEFTTDSSANNVSVPAYSSITLSQSYYGDILIEKKCTVRFTQTDIRINSLQVKDNVVLIFENCSKIKIRNHLNLGIGCVFNPEENRVALFIEGNMTVGKSCTVNGDFRVLNGNLVVKKGEPARPNRMKGLFAAREVHAFEYTEWQLAENRFEICEYTAPPAAHAIGNNESDLAVSLRGIEHTFDKPASLRISPNPFCCKSILQFEVAEDSKVRLDAYDATGKLVKQLFEGEIKAGEIHQSELDVASVPQGIIFIRLHSEAGVYYQKAMVIR